MPFGSAKEYHARAFLDRDPPSASRLSCKKSRMAAYNWGKRRCRGDQKKCGCLVFQEIAEDEISNDDLLYETSPHENCQVHYILDVALSSAHQRYLTSLPKDRNKN